MACLKCGSSWVTLNGRNMVSCPDCCKQQRCKARKQGRLPTVQSMNCKRCGLEFAVQGSAVSAAKFCNDCRKPARNEKQRQRLESNRNESTRRLRVHRTLSSFVSNIQAAMNSQRAASKRSNTTLRNPPRFCCSCSKPFVSDPRHESRFCSNECASAWSRNVPCRLCGEIVAIRAIGRDARKRRCSAVCKRCAIRRWRATAKAKDARRLRDNHRKRCRLHGVPYDPRVTARLVFERDKYKCHICGNQTLFLFAWKGAVPDERSPTIDHHPHPLSAGVSGHEWHNVRCACWGCNVRKGASLLPADLCPNNEQSLPTGGGGATRQACVRKTRCSYREERLRKSLTGVGHG
jgi:hypothetical protein